MHNSKHIYSNDTSLPSGSWCFYSYGCLHPARHLLNCSVRHGRQQRTSSLTTLYARERHWKLLRTCRRLRTKAMYTRVPRTSGPTTQARKTSYLTKRSINGLKKSLIPKYQQFTMTDRAVQSVIFCLNTTQN